MVTIFTLCGIIVHFTIDGYLRAGKQAIALQYAIAARYRRADRNSTDTADQPPSETK